MRGEWSDEKIIMYHIYLSCIIPGPFTRVLKKRGKKGAGRYQYGVCTGKRKGR